MAPFWSLLLMTAATKNNLITTDDTTSDDTTSDANKTPTLTDDTNTDGTNSDANKTPTLTDTDPTVDFKTFLTICHFLPYRVLKPLIKDENTIADIGQKAWLRCWKAYGSLRKPLSTWKKTLILITRRIR